MNHVYDVLSAVILASCRLIHVADVWTGRALNNAVGNRENFCKFLKRKRLSSSLHAFWEILIWCYMEVEPKGLMPKCKMLETRRTLFRDFERRWGEKRKTEIPSRTWSLRRRLLLRNFTNHMYCRLELFCSTPVGWDVIRDRSKKETSENYNEHRRTTSQAESWPPVVLTSTVYLICLWSSLKGRVKCRSEFRSSGKGNRVVTKSGMSLGHQVLLRGTEAKFLYFLS